MVHPILACQAFSLLPMPCHPRACCHSFLVLGVLLPYTPSSPFICWLPSRMMLLLPCCIRIVGFRFRVQRGLWASLPVSSCALLHTCVVAMCGWIERGCCLMVYVMAREWLLVCMCWWAPCLCGEPCACAPLQLCAKVVNSPLAWMRFLCCLPLRRNRCPLRIIFRLSLALLVLVRGGPKCGSCVPMPRLICRVHGPCVLHVLGDAEHVVGVGTCPLVAFVIALCRSTRSTVVPVLTSERCLGMAHAVPASLRNATWLILPVVICLSQRLSHACVSMN